MVSRTVIPSAMFPEGGSESDPVPRTGTPSAMTRSGKGKPLNEQMIQDYPCGDEAGHYFISSPLNVCSIGRSDSAVLYVEGGCPNFTWASDNEWATFSSAETAVRYNTIESAAGEGQDTTVTVTDANGLEVTIDVPYCDAASCCDDPPTFSIQTSGDELGPFPGENVVFLDGGCPPFSWNSVGDGFTLDYVETNSRRNRVHGTEDNVLVVDVEDSCGQTDFVFHEGSGSLPSLALVLVKCTDKKLVERTIIAIDGTDLSVDNLPELDNSLVGGIVHFNNLGGGFEITSYAPGGSSDVIGITEIPEGMTVGSSIVIETNDDADDPCRGEAVFFVDTDLEPPFYLQVWFTTPEPVWVVVSSEVGCNFAYICRYFLCDTTFYRVSKYPNEAGDDFLVDSCDPDNIGSSEELELCEKAHSEYEGAWDEEESDDTIDRGGTANVAVTTDEECFGPFSWMVEEDGYWFDAEYTLKEIQTDENHTTLYADETICDSATITAEDKCKTHTGYVAFAASPLAWDDDNSTDAIYQNHSGAIAVSGGVGPFDWSVSGTGFWLDESHTLTELTTDTRTTTLWADATACGTATINVTDDCEGSCTGEVRCADAGNWVDKGYGCVLGGMAGEYTGEGPSGFHHFTLTHGKYRQAQITRSNGGRASTYDSALNACMASVSEKGHNGNCIDQEFQMQTCVPYIYESDGWWYWKHYYTEENSFTYEEWEC